MNKGKLMRILIISCIIVSMCLLLVAFLDNDLDDTMSFSDNLKEQVAQEEANSYSEKKVKFQLPDKISYSTYENDRFNFKIKVPDFLIQLSFSENQDGAEFHNKNRSVRLVIYGSYSPVVFGYSTVEEIYKKELENHSFSKGNFDDKSFELRWKEKDGENNIYYHYKKYIINPDGTDNTIEISYPCEIENFEKIINKVVNSLRVGNNKNKENSIILDEYNDGFSEIEYKEYINKAYGVSIKIPNFLNESKTNVFSPCFKRWESETGDITVSLDFLQI